MTTKEAIAGARNVAMAFEIGSKAYDGIMQVCDDLLASQERERILKLAVKLLALTDSRIIGGLKAEIRKLKGEKR